MSHLFGIDRWDFFPVNQLIHVTLKVVKARHPDVLLMTIKTYNWQTKHNTFIVIYCFRATCFDCLDSSSCPLTNWPKTI